MSRTSSPGATNPNEPSLVARLQQAIEERHGWKRLDDEDPEDAAATALALASVPVGTAVTVPTRQVDVLTVRWTKSLRNISRATCRHKARAGRREARPTGRRTSRTSSSSRTSSNDPGSDSSDDPEPSPAPRRCAAPWCAHLVIGAGQRRFCGTERCNEARAAERQRQSRHRNVDLVEAERREALQNARLAGMIGSHAFAPAGEHSLSFLWGTRWSPKKIVNVDSGDPGERDARALWVWCRCNGRHVNDGDGGCFRCGHWRGAVMA